MSRREIEAIRSETKIEVVESKEGIGLGGTNVTDNAVSGIGTKDTSNTEVTRNMIPVRDDVLKFKLVVPWAVHASVLQGNIIHLFGYSPYASRVL